MRIKTIIAGGLMFAVAGSLSAEFSPATLQWSPQDRILVLSPHPDDDILGCAGVIQSAVEKHLPVKVVYLTNGDNYEWAFWAYKKRPVLSPEEMRKMGMLRSQEAINGEQVLGVPKDQLVFLGYPDWGTEKIFTGHWTDQSGVFRSMLTKVTAVPYPGAFRPSAPYTGPSVLADLKAILLDFKPTKIFVSHPADGHRDHRTYFLFCQVALWDLAGQIQPEVYPFLVHHSHWPRPKGLHPERDFQPPTAWRNLQWVEYPLMPAQTQAKAAALKAHHTQMVLDKDYLNSFVASREWFGRLPVLQVGSINAPTTIVSSHTLQAMEEEVEISTDTAQAAVQSIYRENDHLILKTRISSRPHFRHPVQLYAFGYRHDRPFAEMPKLRMEIHGAQVKVFDQNLPVLDSGIRIERNHRELLIRLPLRALGDPEKIIGTAWSNSAEPPFDRRAWHVLDLGVDRD